MCLYFEVFSDSKIKEGAKNKRNPTNPWGHFRETLHGNATCCHGSWRCFVPGEGERKSAGNGGFYLQHLETPSPFDVLKYLIKIKCCCPYLYKCFIILYITAQPAWFLM